MRPINKGTEPEAFTRWKVGASEDWRPGWEAFRGNKVVRNEVMQALLKDQGYVCCYCEQRISLELKPPPHIEHLDARSEVPERRIDFLNLLACCKHEERRVPTHCGSRRGNRPLAVHPLMPDCREFFMFTGDGGISPPLAPERQQRARETIQVLGLDVDKLVAQRKKAIDGFMQELQSLPPEQQRLLVTRLDRKDAQGQHTEFASAILSVLKGQPRH